MFMSTISGVILTFNQISKIPRESGNEKAIRKWLVNWSKANEFSYLVDSKGNLTVRNYSQSNKQPITLQAHLDMVCQKTQESKHNFTKDPIQVVETGGWLRAKDTSLGADNGIAIAIMMQLAEEYENKVALELLFTIEEEIGLCGAKDLEEEMLTGNVLINLDSEDEGVCTIGCAGGARIDINSEHTLTDEIKSNVYKLSISGLAGGHSGVDINKNRLNANIVLLKLLSDIANKSDINIIEFVGGTVDNAIPRSAYAVFASEHDLNTLQNLVNTSVSQFSSIESEVKFELEVNSETSEVEGINYSDSKRLIEFLTNIPNGVISLINNNLVECSSNLGVLKVINGRMECDILTRSSNDPKLDEVINKIRSLAQEYNFNFKLGERYPGWLPDFNSSLLAKTKQVYSELFNKDLVVDVIHAGLECGVLVKKGSNVDAISLGPTIKDPHSPNEKVELDSIEKLYKFLKRLIVTI